MREVVYVLSIWSAGLYVVGLATGWLTRHATAYAIRRQHRRYYATTGRRAPDSAMRGMGIGTWATVVAGIILLASLAEYMGIRPPGAEGFQFAAFFIGVLPACVVGAALGASYGVAHREAVLEVALVPSWRLQVSFAGAVILLVVSIV